MNGDRAMAQSLCAGIVEGAAGIENVEIALCPPYTLLGDSSHPKPPGVSVADLGEDRQRPRCVWEAAGAIATAATHGQNHPASQATRHTWQVAHQVAVAKGPHQRRAAPQEAPTNFPHRAQRHHRARPMLTPREQPPATHVARETSA